MQAIKNTIAENLGGFSHSLAPEKHQFELDQTPSLSGKVAVVTGGSEGIGYGCTHTLLSHDIARIFILSVSQEVVDGALKSISEEMGADTAKKVTWYKCDISDWKEVKETADKIVKNTDRLDILINAAARGIMTYQLTNYGVDRHMALNHMGHVVLTSHLLPLMKKTASGGNTIRIVNFGSNLHESAPSNCKFESLDELNQDLGPNPLYGRSKLATMLHARYLAKRVTSAYPNILANCVHPGIVETKMSKDDIHEPYPVSGYAMSVGLGPFKKDQFMGCVSAVFAATKTEQSGQYICPPAIPEEGSKLFRDDKVMENLMSLTEKVVKEKTFDESAAKGCPFKMY